MIVVVLCHSFLPLPNHSLSSGYLFCAIHYCLFQLLSFTLPKMRERLPRYSSPPPQVRKSPHRVKKGQKERLNTVFTKALAVLLRLQPTQGKVAVILEVGGVLDTFVSEEHPSWPPSRDEIYVSTPLLEARQQSSCIRSQRQAKTLFTCLGTYFP